MVGWDVIKVYLINAVYFFVVKQYVFTYFLNGSYYKAFFNFYEFLNLLKPILLFAYLFVKICLVHCIHENAIKIKTCN